MSLGFAPTLAFALLAPGDAPASAGPADTEDVGVVEHEEHDPTVFPDPAKFNRGFFVEAGTGPMFALGPTSRVLSPGFSLTGRIGYEIRRWIAVQGHVTGSISKYDDGVLRGELLQQYVYTGELRFGIPIRRFLVAFQGGAGLYQVSTNVLQIAGIAADNARLGLAWDASLAFDVHSLAREFSGGIVLTYIGYPALSNAGSLLAQLYLRFTL